MPKANSMCNKFEKSLTTHKAHAFGYIRNNIAFFENKNILRVTTTVIISLIYMKDRKHIAI